MLRHVNGTDLALKPPLTRIIVGLESLHCIVGGGNVGVEEIVPWVNPWTMNEEGLASSLVGKVFVSRIASVLTSIWTCRRRLATWILRFRLELGKIRNVMISVKHCKYIVSKSPWAICLGGCWSPAAGRSWNLKEVISWKSCMSVFALGSLYARRDSWGTNLR